MAGALWSAQDRYAVLSSTPTVTKKHRPLRQLRRLKQMGQKVLTSNPGFEAPSVYPLPLKAPRFPPVTPPPMPPSTAPPVERFLKAAAHVMTTTWNENIFVWLPALSTDPNSGPTYGILPVLVLADKTTQQIRHLMAPSYTNNSLFGQTATMRYYYYPKPESQLFVLGGYSEHTNREIKVRYEDAAFLDGRAFIRAEGIRNVDGSMRYFGPGPQSHEGDESGYTMHDTGFNFAMGVNFLRSWRASAGVYFHRVEEGPNVVPDVQDMATRFPGTFGLTPQNTVAPELRILWDSRDYPITPSHGSSGEFFVQNTSRLLSSDADYVRYGLEGKRFFPWHDPNKVTAVHALYDWVNGPRIPFYDLASLGGRETLRGFGDGRFEDRGRLLFNVEQRFTVASLPLLGVPTKFEIAPFVDCGEVFPTLPQVNRKYFLPVYGSAFRAVVVPNVVGAVDFGIGKEGPAVFVGINYPF
jgi:hypothetical protein